MIIPKRTFIFPAGLLLISWMILVSCSGPEKLSKEGYRPSQAEGRAIADRLPDYTGTLNTVKGKGRAIVSEPNNTERVILLFTSNRSKSLVTIRSGIGIEGGKLLTDGDTLLVYNKVDNYARRIPIRSGRLDRINKLASLNILDMINFTVNAEDIRKVEENDTHFKLFLSTGARIFIDKESYLINEVIQPPNSPLPYAKIQYEAYAQLNEFKLPRRITIFGAEEQSKIALQVGTLELNPPIDSLGINLPNDIRIYHK